MVVSNLTFALTPLVRQRRFGCLVRMVLALLLLLLCNGGSGVSSAQTSDNQTKNTTTKREAKQGKKPKGPTEPKKSILVFPADTKEGPGEQLGDIITDVVKARLAATETYEPNLFTISSPTFRRALSEQTLVQKDVKPPFDSNAKVQKLAQFAGYNFAVTESLDDYQYDAAKQQVSIVLTVTLIDFSSGKPMPRPFGDSAATAAKGVKDATDIAPVIDLARNLTEKIMTELLKPVKPAAK